MIWSGLKCMVCWNEKRWFPRSPCSGRSKGRSEPDLCRNRLCVQRQDPVRIDVHPPVQLDVRPILDGAGAGQLGSQKFGHLWSNPKGSQLTHPKKNLESIFLGVPPGIIHFFSWKCWVIVHPKKASSGASPSVLEALLDGSWTPSVTILPRPKRSEKPGKLIGFQAIHGYPPSKIGKSWKIEKEKNPPKTMGISFVNNFFLSIFPLKPLENHGTSIFSQPNQSKKKHFAVQSRRLIRRFLAMLMQPVRLQLLESDGMMGWWFLGPKKIMGNDGKWWNDEIIVWNFRVDSRHPLQFSMVSRIYFQWCQFSKVSAKSRDPSLQLFEAPLTSALLLYTRLQ